MSEATHNCRESANVAGRRQLSRAATDRLRTYILMGMGLVLVVQSVCGSLLTLLNNQLDPSMLRGFAPDLIFGGAVLWLVVRCGRPQAAVYTLAVYFAVNFTFISLQIGGLALFATPWPLLPILVGMYVGGSRLKWCMIALIAFDAACAIAVAVSGIGLSMMTIPSLDSLAGIATAGLGLVFVLLIIAVAEHSRHRIRRELDDALVDLDEQEHRLHTLLENTSDAILLLDSDYRILAANSTAIDLMGSVAGRFEPLVGRDFLTVVSRDRADRWHTQLKECVKTGEVRLEDVVQGPSEERHLESSIHSIPSHNGRGGFTLFTRDITERRKAEVELQRLRGQLLDVSRLAGPRRGGIKRTPQCGQRAQYRECFA